MSETPEHLPRFAPRRSTREVGAQAAQGTQSAAQSYAGQASPINPINQVNSTQATYRANRGSQTRQASRNTPPSFAPHDAHGAHQPPRNAAQAMPLAFQPQQAKAQQASRQARASQSQRPQPRQIQPQRTHMRASNMPGTAAASPIHASTAQTQGSYEPQTYRASTPQTQASTAHTALATRPRRHCVRRTLLVTLALLVLAALLTTALAWQWVDARLQREPWLTSTPADEATSWLLLGSDQRDDSNGIGGTAEDTPGFRTDTILVLTKPKHGASSLISIPRDSLVSVGGQFRKINSVAQADGKQALVSAVEHITGHKIDHVALIKFDGLERVVDALGGVRLCYDRTVQDGRSGLDWQAGCHIAQGEQALAFARMRYSDPQGDFGRAARQRQVIGAIMRQASSAGVLMNPFALMGVGDAALRSIVVDTHSNPYTTMQMALAFREASGAQGVNGSVYWTNPDYHVAGVGSTVLLNDSRNQELFNQLNEGSHAPGVVGTLADQQ